MLIGDLSARTEASRRSLRHYEAAGLLTSTRGPNGYRDYPDAAVEIVARIRALLGAGLSVAIIRRVLPCTLDATPRVVPCAELTALLRSQLAQMDQQRADLDRSRELISGMLA